MTISGQVRPVAEINLNPPCVLPLFQLLSRLPIERFAHAWAVGSFVLLLATVALLMWHRPNLQRRQIVWLLLSTPVLFTLMNCQMYFLLFFLCTIALIFVENGHEIPAAVAIGIVVAFKPTMAYWPLFLFLSGFKRIATWACVVALAVGLGPLAFYGPGVYREWLHAVAIDNHWMFPTDIAIPAYFARLGLRAFGIALAVGIAVLLSWTVYKTKPSFITVSGLALCAAILCAPLSWVDYALLLAPYFVSHRWKLPSIIAAALLMVPNLVPSFLSRPPGRLGVALGSGIYFAAFWIMVFVFYKSATHTLSSNRAFET
jgi:alpha-1,2-mannosyltransferase